LFRKSLENLRKTDRKIIIEYGLFLYQMHSYCSRQIKIVTNFFYILLLKLQKLNDISNVLKDKVTNHFKDDSIKIYLENKKNELLKLALEAYKSASKSKPERQIEEITIDSSSSNDEQSTQENSRSAGDKPKNQNQSSKSASQNADDREEWFNQYMIGKIKEKLDTNNFVACLEHYKKVTCMVKEYFNRINCSNNFHILVYRVS